MNIKFVFLFHAVQFFPYLRECAVKYKAMFRFWSFGVIHISAIRARDAEILMNSTAHAKKPWIYKFLHGFLGLGLLTSNGEKWKARRRILTPSFHFNILRSFTTIFIEESVKVVTRLNNDIEKGAAVQDVSLLACEYTMPTICESAMGVKVDDMKEAEEYRVNLLALIQTFPIRLVRSYLHPDFIYKLLGLERRQRKLLKPIHNFTKTVIEKRRKMFYENKSGMDDLQNENV